VQGVEPQGPGKGRCGGFEGMALDGVGACPRTHPPPRAGILEQ